MSNCKDCKWWTEQSTDTWQGIDPAYRRCDVLSMYYGLTPRLVEQEEHPEGGSCDVFTAPNFGCVQFTPHEDKS